LWIGLAFGLAAVSLQLLARWRRRERNGFLLEAQSAAAPAERGTPIALAD
jgi:hypothetical protein